MSSRESQLRSPQLPPTVPQTFLARSRNPTPKRRQGDSSFLRSRRQSNPTRLLDIRPLALRSRPLPRKRPNPKPLASRKPKNLYKIFTRANPVTRTAEDMTEVGRFADREERFLGALGLLQLFQFIEKAAPKGLLIWCLGVDGGGDGRGRECG